MGNSVRLNIFQMFCKSMSSVIAAILLLLAQPAVLFSVEAAQSVAQSVQATAVQVDGNHSAKSEEAAAKEGIPVAPQTLFTIPIGEKGLPFTNSMAMTWVVSILIIIGIRLAVRRPTLIPGKGQAVVEVMISALRDLIEMIVGPKMIGKTFPILICLFTFILIQNWCGLIPGLGAVGFVENGHIVPFLRPGNADMNMVFGLTLVHFLAWLYFVMRYAGPKALFLDIFGNKAPKNEVPKAMYIMMFGLFAFVGCIDLISLVFRNVSLPLRLFGNIFGGDNLMEHMTTLSGWLVPIPFYFMEILVGIVQAMVFTILVAVYIGQICNHSEANAH
jgi:F-type H+-transporting ATPase subunit a